MEYLITFLEGILTFISPCLLPMLPVYLTYMAAGAVGEKRPLGRALAFVLGFSAVFILMGAAAATFGRFILKHTAAVNLIGGLIVILLGVHFTGLVRLPFLNRTIRPNFRILPDRFLSAFVFGVIFALGWTPCVGVFLGSALTMAALSGTFAQGILLLIAYCLGLGLPFILSALFIKELSSVFSIIKKHYGVINLLCGLFLIILGVMMMMGKVRL